MSTAKREYKALMIEHTRRQERNGRLLARLENIEKKAAFLQAKTDRIKSLKSIYRNQVDKPTKNINVYSNFNNRVIAERIPVTIGPNNHDFSYYDPLQYSNYRYERIYNEPNPLYTHRPITLDDAIEEISRRFVLIPKDPEKVHRKPRQPPDGNREFHGQYDNIRKYDEENSGSDGDKRESKGEKTGNVRFDDLTSDINEYLKERRRDLKLKPDLSDDDDSEKYVNKIDTEKEIDSNVIEIYNQRKDTEIKEPKLNENQINLKINEEKENTIIENIIKDDIKENEKIQDQQMETVDNQNVSDGAQLVNKDSNIQKHQASDEQTVEYMNPSNEYDQNYVYNPEVHQVYDENQVYPEQVQQEYSEEQNYVEQLQQNYVQDQSYPEGIPQDQNIEQSHDYVEDQNYVEQTGPQYIEQTDQQYSDQTDQQYSDQNNQQYVEQTDQQYVEPNGQQYAEQTNQEYIDQNNQQYVEQTDQQYVEQTDQQYVEQTDQQYVEQSDQQYVEQTDQQYVEQTDQQYVEQTDQQYVEQTDQQYVEQTDQQYVEQTDQQYVEQTDQQYVEQTDQQYVEQTDQQYADQTGQGYAAQEYLDQTDQNYAVDPNYIDPNMQNYEQGNAEQVQNQEYYDQNQYATGEVTNEQYYQQNQEITGQVYDESNVDPNYVQNQIPQGAEGEYDAAYQQENYYPQGDISDVDAVNVEEAKPLKILESDTESNIDESNKQESDFDFSLAQ